MGYETEYISLSDKQLWFLDISPTGQVPLLVTDAGAILFENDAIVEYIEEVTPPLVGGITPEPRVRDRAWRHQASKHYLVQCSAMQSKDKMSLSEREAKLELAFERAERWLENGSYFNGQSLGNVDIAWRPLLHRT